MEHISQTIKEAMQELRKSESLHLQRKKEMPLDMKKASEKDLKYLAFQGNGKSFFNFLSLRNAKQVIVRQE